MIDSGRNLLVGSLGSPLIIKTDFLYSNLFLRMYIKEQGEPERYSIYHTPGKNNNCPMGQLTQDTIASLARLFNSNQSNESTITRHIFKSKKHS